MPEEEIDLARYLIIILRRKNEIILASLVTMIMAVFFTFIFYYLFYEYLINTILEIGHMEEFVPETPAQLAQKIQNDNYGPAIRTKLGISEAEYPDYRKWKISTPQGTRLLIINIETQEPQKIKKILEELSSLIMKEHQKKFELQKNILLDSKKRIENKIKFLEEEEKILKEKIDYLTGLQAREPSLTNQFLLTEAKKEYEGKKAEIAEEYLELNKLSRRLEDYEPTHEVKKPIIPEKVPLGINKILINLILGLILGIFFGIFGVFFLEFLEKSKSKGLTRN